MWTCVDAGWSWRTMGRPGHTSAKCAYMPTSMSSGVGAASLVGVTITAAERTPARFPPCVSFPMGQRFWSRLREYLRCLKWPQLEEQDLRFGASFEVLALDFELWTETTIPFPQELDAQANRQGRNFAKNRSTNSFKLPIEHACL